MGVLPHSLDASPLLAIRITLRGALKELWHSRQDPRDALAILLLESNNAAAAIRRFS
jgi:hypothetical protein